MLRIGELAERSGKSTHTLRWYEKQGLIPNVGRDGGGRRVYTERHLLWIDLLGKLSATGMTIEEIRGYAELVQAGDSTLEARIRLLSEHRVAVEARIGDLREALALIDTKLSMYRDWLDTGGSPVEVPEDPTRSG